MRLLTICAAFTSLATFLCCIGQNAYADCPHIISDRQSPCLFAHYRLQDITEIDLEPGALTKLKNTPSLGPSINNNGTIIGNRSTGGFVYLKGHGEYTPCVNGAKINFYALNDIEDLVVGISRSPRSVEWLLWPTSDGWCSPRIPINTCELEAYKVSLSAINDQRTIAGEAHPDDRSFPLAWDKNNRLHRIGNSQQIDLQGTVKGLNYSGWIVGHKNCYLENFPYVWNGCEVLDLFKLRSRFKSPSDAKIQFEDLSITDDGTIYGTYWINTEFFENTSTKPIKYQAFAWNPNSNSLDFVDLDGMRITKVNSKHRLVGSLNGKAAFADCNFKPHELSSAVDEKDLNGWELLEATDINDQGQIVGYGLLNGKMHIFLADPL